MPTQNDIKPHGLGLERDIRKIIDFDGYFAEVLAKGLSTAEELTPELKEEMITKLRAQWEVDQPHFNGQAPHRYNRGDPFYCCYCGRPRSYEPRKDPMEIPDDITYACIDEWFSEAPLQDKDGMRAIYRDRMQRVLAFGLGLLLKHELDRQLELRQHLEDPEVGNELNFEPRPSKHEYGDPDPEPRWDEDEGCWVGKDNP
jgi:hypothetical protein